MDPTTDTGTAADTDTDTTTAAAQTDIGTAPATPDLQAEVDKWKALSRKHEKQSRENAAAATTAADRQASLDKVLAALGMESGATTPDAAAVTAQLQAAQTAAAQQARENAVLRAAGRLGADGDQLLDSRAFLAAIGDLDPADTAAIGEAITEAVKTNPRYAAGAATGAPATPTRQASGTTDFNGSPGGQRQWTEADVVRATTAQLEKATADGLLKQFLTH